MSRIHGLPSILASLLLLAGPLQGQYPDIHSEHFLYGHPTGAPGSNDLVIRDIYALSSNDETKLADWVAYRLDHRIVDGPDLERDWSADPWMEGDETLEPDDYDGAHGKLDVDRGHQAPLASFRGTHAGGQSNVLSNVTPQMGPLNQGAWKDLEETIRKLAYRDTLHVVTGPLYERDMPQLPEADEPHQIPSHYWKIVAFDGPEGLQAVAFVMDQDTDWGADYCERRVSVDEVEARSGLNFFWRLDDEEEETVEASEGSEGLAERLGC